MDLNYGSPGPAFEEHPLHHSHSSSPVRPAITLPALLSPPIPPPSLSLPVLSIRLFGSITVNRHDVVLGAKDLGGTKPRQILSVLALNLGVPVSKNRLIGLLWGEHPPAEALSTLESYVSVLRRHVQPGAGKDGPIQTGNGGYTLDRRLVEVDLDRFTGLLAEAHHAAPADAFAHLSAALDLASAPLLADELGSPWAADERARHTQLLTDTRVLAAEAAAVLSRTELSIELAHTAVTDDPLNERAWTALILGLEAAGRPTDGLQHYARCRQLLDEELGCSPGRTLRDAHARLLRATGDGEGELSDVVSALLVLHDRMRCPSGGPSSYSDSLSHASDVVEAFLRRAMAALGLPDVVNGQFSGSVPVTHGQGSSTGPYWPGG